MGRPAGCTGRTWSGWLTSIDRRSCRAAERLAAAGLVTNHRKGRTRSFEQQRKGAALERHVISELAA
jgi:hypothetical protein